VQLEDTGRDLAPLPSSSKSIAQIPMRPSLFDQIQERRRAAAAARTGGQKRERADVAGDARAAARDGREPAARGGAAALSKQLEPAVAALPDTMHQVDRAMASANTLLQPNGPLVANLNKAGSAAEQVGVALNDLNARVQYDTLPRFNALAGSVGDASRQLKDVAGELGRNPSSLLFGSPAPRRARRAGFVWPGTTVAK
jgi:phospholipid/cholesterol/gamma-HCH transport system substrate-binding protein